MIRLCLLLLCFLPLHAEMNSAYFAGGCFWCVEADFAKVEGVIATTSGYAGGSEAHPTYEEVSSGKTGHVETVKIDYDPSLVSYTELLHIYWPSIDPTRNDGQFCDSGPQYRPVIFYSSPEQKEEAVASKERITEESGLSPILVDILPLKTFYPAEGYHQDYYKKNPYRYKLYRWNCGREQRLKELWGR